MTVNFLNVSKPIFSSNLYSLDRTLAQSTLRLSTGNRINGAADGSNELARITTLKSEIASALNYARMTTDAVALFDVADSSLSEISDMIIEFRELAVQASSSSTTSTTRSNLNTEATAIATAITTLAGDTEYNGTKLLDGTFTANTFFLGEGTSSSLSATLTSSLASALGAYLLEGSTKSATTAASSATANDITDAEDATVAGTTIEATANESALSFATKINAVSDTTGVFATAETHAHLATTQASSTSYTISINDVSTASFNMSGSDVSGAVAAINAIASSTGVTAESTSAFEVLLHDSTGADMTIENGSSSTGLTVAAVQRDASTESGSQVSLAASSSTDATRVSGTIRLSSDAVFTVVQSGTDSQGYLSDSTATQSLLSTAALSSVVDAAKAITIADSASNQISLLRGSIASYIQQLEFSNSVHLSQHTEKSIGLANLSDADIAVESAELAKAQMLKKVTLAMQAQIQDENNNIVELIRSLRLAA